MKPISNEPKTYGKVEQGNDERTYKQSVTMDNGRKFVVTIHYPVGQSPSLEEVDRAMRAQVNKLVKLAIKLDLGKEKGLQKIQVTNTGVFGEWKNVGRKDFKEKLEAEKALLKEGDPKIREIAKKLKAIEKTTNTFKSTFPTATIRATIPKLARYSNKSGVDFNTPVDVRDSKGKFAVVDKQGKNRAHITWFFLNTENKGLSTAEKDAIPERARENF